MVDVSKTTVVLDLFSNDTSVENFVFALRQNPYRKNESTKYGSESLLVFVVRRKNVDKLKLLVSLGCVIDENIAAEKSQGHQNKVK